MPAPAFSAADVVGADCLAIDDSFERLACFDRAVGDAVKASAPVPAAAADSATAVTAAGPSPATVPTGDAPRPAEPGSPAREYSRVDTVWGLLPSSKTAYVRLHRPNYILPARYTTDVNRAPYEPLFDAFADDSDFSDVEAKFQLSVKARLLADEERRWGLWFAYTQQNQWQIYESDISRPFRETNYEPEVFVSFHPNLDVGGWRLNLVNAGYNHQSNGRADPISRSWDRLFVEAALERGNLVLLGRAWVRIRLGEEEDDNPGITDYYGNAEINAQYTWRGNTFALMGRGNPSSGKGAAQFTWSSRPLLGPLRGYVQLFSGYGESMIDYDWNQTTIGIGVTLNERF